MDDDGGVDVKTVDVPYQTRQAKLELDEKNIYRFGMGVNTAGLKDTNATTNIAIKAAYSLLDLKCSKLEIRLKQLLRRLMKLIIVEINETDGTDYHCNQVYFEFSHEAMSNEQENKPAEAQKALDGVNADESETKGNILTSCGQQQKETDEQEVSKTTETTETDFTDKGQSELSELEKQIEEFEKGTSDETTITQDILRGEWRMTSKDDLVNGGFQPETVKLGNLEVDYDTSSKDSKIIFTDDEFMIFYDEPEVKYGEEEKRYSKLMNDITVSGLYRVINQDNFNEEKDSYESEIELLITNVSPKYGFMNTDIYSELNSLIGTTINKEVKFYTFYEDWSNVTEEELNEYEIEVHEEVNISIGGEITMSGFIYYDEPILSKGYPMTCGWLSQSDDEQLYTGYSRTKTKNTLNLNKKEKKGVWLYDVTPQEEVETTE